MILCLVPMSSYCINVYSRTSKQLNYLLKTCFKHQVTLFGRTMKHFWCVGINICTILKPKVRNGSKCHHIGATNRFRK